METLREDPELQSFFKQLVSTFMNPESQYARIDLLLNPVDQGGQGTQLLKRLKELLAVPVFASNDILGACLSEDSGQEGKRSAQFTLNLHCNKFNCTALFVLGLYTLNLSV